MTIDPAAAPSPFGESTEAPIAPPAPPSRARALAGRFRRLVVGGAVALAVTFGFAYFQGDQEKKAAPVAGECGRITTDAKEGEGVDMEKVACDADTAEFRVTKRVDDTADGETACADDAESTSYFSYDNKGVSSFVLCVVDF